MDRTLKAQVAFPTSPRHGEGAWWAVREQALVWVDMVGCSVHRVREGDDAAESWPAPEYTGVAVGRDRGGLLVMMGSGMAVLDTESGSLAWITRVPGTGGDRKLNDGKCDPRGRFVCGSKTADPAIAPASIYVLDPDWSLRTLFSGMTLSNGLAWSSDGATLYVVDSRPRLIRAFGYDMETGTITRQRPPIDVPQGIGGTPDGMTIDDDGCLWVAMHRGGTVRRITPAGRLDATVALPVSGPTSCAFGGPALEDLYITTSPYVLSAKERAEQPLAGSIFVCRPGVNGRPEPYFAG